jgi:hypothetical protein
MTTNTASTKLQSLAAEFIAADVTFDGANDYAIANNFLKSKGIRADNKQVWSFINEVNASAGEAADW